MEQQQQQDPVNERARWEDHAVYYRAACFVGARSLRDALGSTKDHRGIQGEVRKER